MNFKKSFYRLLIVVLMLNLTIAVCGAAEKINPNLIKFLGTGWETDTNGVNIFIGTLQNTAGKDVEFIGLRCAFIDGKGVELDHGLVIVRDVAKNEQAKFKFYPPAPAGTVTATITEVDAYAK